MSKIHDSEIEALYKEYKEKLRLNDLDSQRDRIVIYTKLLKRGYDIKGKTLIKLKD